ncbi:MAG TPA: hypothetical protein VL171_11290 [Verrucomicrobiae bacterium]|nr:hypothetical protein [Verrucomicrobiae bacterium]
MDRLTEKLLDAPEIRRPRAFGVAQHPGGYGLGLGAIVFNFLLDRAKRLLMRQAVAWDILAPAVTTVSLDEDLAWALENLRLAMRGERPVVDSKDFGRFVGVLRRRT